jgi:hypothetical protein
MERALEKILIDPEEEMAEDPKLNPRLYPRVK